MSRGFVGRRVKRLEDPRLLRGAGSFLDDISLPGLLHASIVRSQYPHALVKRIDVSDALRVPGVVSVYTFREAERLVKPLDFEVPSDPMYPLAKGKVKYYGEPVAMVVAEDPYTASDAAELVSVDYEPLEPVVSPERALEDDSPIIHERLKNNLASSRTYSCGRVDEAFRSSPIVVSEDLYMERVYPSPMETRGALASYDGESLTVWSSTQTPFDLKEALEEKLVKKPGRVRVIQPDVGGAFGSKIPTYPEELLVAMASIDTGRPVKWYASRSEDMVSTTHGRGLRARVEIAADRSGRVRGLRARIVADLGAYPIGYALPLIAARILTGGYDIRNGVVKALGVYTNKTPLGAYRGAGRPEGIFFIERMMDVLADEIGVDPVDVRMLNLVSPGQMPYRNCFGMVYDSGDYPETLRKAVEVLGLRSLEQWASRERSKGRLIGVGYSFYVEITSGGPFESAKVRLEPDGKVKVIVGSTPTGQGSATSLAQIAAEKLGVDVSDVEVLWGDTDLLEEGIGTFGSRTTAVGGGAVIKAIEHLLEKARLTAASLLDSRPEDLEYGGGRFYVRSDPSRAVTLREVASLASKEAAGGAIEAGSKYNPGRPVYPFGVHLAVVEVDAETGVARVLEYRSLDDVGRAINPMLVEGQIVGGVAQAIGQTFYESLEYDESGYPRVTSLADYGVPTSLEIPGIKVEIQETPSHHPHGARGVGEIGSIAAPPALVRALENALKGYGIRLRGTPLLPSKVRELLEARKA